MWHYVLCTGCGQVIMASEPCSCVFEVNGVVDSHGVLHTPQRLKLEVLHLSILPEELAFREWRSSLVPEPCGDPEWTEEALDAAVAYMDEVEERAQLGTMRAAEWAVQQFVSQHVEALDSSRFACGVCGQMTAYTEFDCPCCGASLF